MWLLWLTSARASAPLPIALEEAPPFPEGVEGKVDEACTLSMVSFPDGRHEVLDVGGCSEVFAGAVRSHTARWVWKYVAPPDGSPYPTTYAMITGASGQPEGLYTEIVFRFVRPRGAPQTSVGLQSIPLVQAKKARKWEVPGELVDQVPEAGCQLLVHVDELGRPERVQSNGCPEAIRKSAEVPLMSWSWEPLLVADGARGFVVTFPITSSGLAIEP